MTALMTSSAFARDRACLQNNRIWSWRALDERTLVVNDRQGRPFLVRLSGGCVGLTNATRRIRLVTDTNLGCLERGDRVRFAAPALGRTSCFVRDVRPVDRYYARRDDRYDRGRDRDHYYR